MLAEVASTELGGSKSRWITNFFVGLRRSPDILAFAWFNREKETDWIQSSEAAEHAFATGVADRRYRGAA